MAEGKSNAGTPSRNVTEPGYLRPLRLLACRKTARSECETVGQGEEDRLRLSQVFIPLYSMHSIVFRSHQASPPSPSKTRANLQSTTRYNGIFKAFHSFTTPSSKLTRGHGVAVPPALHISGAWHDAVCISLLIAFSQYGGDLNDQSESGSSLFKPI